MADFSDFEGHAAGTTEEDPVADFMARQKEQLEGIDDDLAFNAGGNDFQPQAGFEQNNQWGNDDFGNNDFIGTGANNDFIGAGAGTNEYENFEGDFGQGGLNIDPPKPTEPSDTFSAIRQADRQRQEPEKIRLWRIEQQERLKKKDEESEKQKAEWRAVAKKELADWYKHHDEQLDKKRRVNREAEREFIAQRDDTVPGHEWERIGRLCDFNAKGVRQQKDVSRMRSILLQLKQTPLVKP